MLSVRTDPLVKGTRYKLHPRDLRKNQIKKSNVPGIRDDSVHYPTNNNPMYKRT